MVTPEAKLFEIASDGDYTADSIVSAFLRLGDITSSGSEDMRRCLIYLNESLREALREIDSYRESY